MDRYRAKTSMLSSRLAYNLVGERHPTIDRTPAPQTSLIFDLPDELILSIFSHISPRPQPTGTGYHARFQAERGMMISDFKDHQQWVRSLLPLSTTCRVMRLRLLPWMWERLECLAQNPSRSSGRLGSGPTPSWRLEWALLGKVNTITEALHADTCLATSVKFMTVYFTSDFSALSKFIKCLGSLQNLHTLEIGHEVGYNVSPPRPKFKGVKLPQIKTLILPPAAHPLLERCPNVEDVNWVIGGRAVSSYEFLGSLALIRDSKIKRLVIPLVLSGNPSKSVAACPRLTELTILCPHPHVLPHDFRFSAIGIPLSPVGSAHFTTIELVNICKELLYFDTLQIVHFSLDASSSGGSPGGRADRLPFMNLASGRERVNHMPLMNQISREQAESMKDWALTCLKKPKTGCEWEGRKKRTLRLIELSSSLTDPGIHHRTRFRPGPVRVEEYEVWGVDSEGPY